MHIVRTCCAVVGDGLPERFADGAAIGKPQAEISALATLCDGILMPTVSSPPLVTIGIFSDFGIIMVRGPAQNFSAHFTAGAVSYPQVPQAEKCQIYALLEDCRQVCPLRRIIFLTAASSKAFAARPYTVSVGIPTTSMPVRQLCGICYAVLVSAKYFLLSNIFYSSS